MVTIGILSDTHETYPSEQFAELCLSTFSSCDVIVHAGDLTDMTLLSVFQGKEVHAVCGNSCNMRTRQSLPVEKVIIIEGVKIAVTHGTGPRHNIEARVFERFPDAACIIFGHTHIPVCHNYANTLLINPGSFRSTGKYGSPGTYAILQIGSAGLKAEIRNLPGIS